VEVTQHLIGPPASEEANSVAVDVAAEERHSPTGAQGADGYIVRENAIKVAHCGDRLA